MKELPESPPSKALVVEIDEDDPVFDKKSWNPSKFTNKNVGTIVDRLVRGFPLNAALADAGVTKTTFNRWIEKAKEGNRRYSNLDEIFELAKNQGIARLHERLLELSKNDGKLALEILRVLDPNTYCEKKTVASLQTKTLNINYIRIRGKDTKRIV